MRAQRNKRLRMSLIYEHSFCRICEPQCGIVTGSVDGQVVEVRPDKSHPYTRGYACNRVLRALDVHRDPDRLDVPLRRQGSHFCDTTWDEAIPEIGAKIRSLIALHGSDSVGLFYGNPLGFNTAGAASIGRFVKSTSCQLFHSGTQDCTNKLVVSEALYGSTMRHTIPDIDRTDLLVLFGTNPRISKSSFLSLPDPVGRLRALNARGGHVLFVNPRNVDPAEATGQTLQLTPGTDAFLLAALLVDLHASRRFAVDVPWDRVDDVSRLMDLLSAYTPDRVAPVCGISADDITSLSGRIATGGRTSFHMSTGVNQSQLGVLGYWLMQVLVVLSGNLEVPGGNFFPARGLPAPRPRTSGRTVATSSGVVATVEGARPGALLAHAITDTSNPLKGLIVVAGNPLLTVPGGEGLRKAFESLELLVVVDLYRNATAELADFVLPSADFFEREDINHFAQGFQPDPYLQWTPAVVPPAGQRKPDSWVLDRLLATTLDGDQIVAAATDPLAFYFDRALAATGLSVDRLRRSPNRILPVPAATAPASAPGETWPMPRFDCAPSSLVDAIARGNEIFDEHLRTPRGSLRLISNRTRLTQNSSFANVAGSSPDEAPNPLYISPLDAGRLGLSDGDDVEITSDHGSVRNSVRLDASLREGVVAMTHGFGNERTRGMTRATARPGVNVNELAGTGPGSYDPISGMSHLTGIRVEIRRL